MVDVFDRLQDAKQKTDLDQAELARILETNPRTVARWLQGNVIPRPEARERLLELVAVLEHLSGVLKPQAAHDWLFSPNPRLEHHKPVELLQSGKYRQVLGEIDVMNEGVFV